MDELALLRRQKIRITPIRKKLLALFVQSGTPLSATKILDLLEGSGLRVNKTTVYRELERFTNAQILSVLQLGDRRYYYELAHRAHHHHLVCLECEEVADIDLNEKELERQEKRVQAERCFEVIRHSLEFFGLCRRCQSLES